MARARFIKLKAKCPKGNRCIFVGRGKKRRKLAIPKKRR